MTIGEDLRRLIEKLADEKPVVRNNDKDKPEVTIMKRGEAAHGEDSMISKQPDDKEVVRTLVKKIPENNPKTDYVSEEESGIQGGSRSPRTDQESGERSKSEGDSEEENLSGESQECDDDSEKSDGDQGSICMILAEEKMRHHDKELQTDPSSATYNLEQQDVGSDTSPEE